MPDRTVDFEENVRFSTASMHKVMGWLGVGGAAVSQPR